MRILAALVLVALLAGCAGRPASAPQTPSAPPTPSVAGNAPGTNPPSDAVTQPQPPTPAPIAPTPPAKDDPCNPARLSPAMVQIWGDSDERRMTAPGGCHFIVGTGQLRVLANDVRAPNAAAAAQALQVVGAKALYPMDVRPSGQSPDGYNLNLILASGPTGQKVQVALTPAPGETPLVATLERKAGPTIAIRWQQPDGSWAPLVSGASLPPGPKKLRLQSTGGMYLGYLKDFFNSTDWRQKIAPDHFTIIANDLVEADFDNPPPLVQVTFNSAGTSDGLRVPWNLSDHFYVGDPPELYARNPTMGAEAKIGPAPPDARFATVRADGRYLAVLALDPNTFDGYAVWLVDLRTGTLTDSSFRYSAGFPPAFDARGRLIASLEDGHLGVLVPETGQAERQPSSATDWSQVSPDGRYIAGHGGEQPHAGTGGWVGPPKAYHLVIRDLMHDTERVFPWEGYAWGLTWLTDGRLILTTSMSDREPWDRSAGDTTQHSFVVNLETGARTPYAEKIAPQSAWPTRPWPKPNEKWLATLPDGRDVILRWANLPNARGLMGP